MREIKFRVWDKVESKFFSPVYEAYNGRLLDLSISLSGELLRRTLENPCEHQSLFPDRYVIMQFTGLTDNTGVNIYEGDVVRIRHRTIGKGNNTKYKYFNCPVEWYDGGFTAHFPEDYGEYRFRDGEWWQGEVIGNIYQHPHLIN